MIGQYGIALNKIDKTHQERIHPFAEVSRNAADDDADNQLKEDNHEADHQGDAAAVHETGQHVHPVVVRAQHNALRMEMSSCPIAARWSAFLMLYVMVDQRDRV